MKMETQQNAQSGTGNQNRSATKAKRTVKERAVEKAITSAMRVSNESEPGTDPNCIPVECVVPILNEVELQTKIEVVAKYSHFLPGSKIWLVEHGDRSFSMEEKLASVAVNASVLVKDMIEGNAEATPVISESNFIKIAELTRRHTIAMLLRKHWADLPEGKKILDEAETAYDNACASLLIPRRTKAIINRRINIAGSGNQLQ